MKKIKAVVFLLVTMVMANVVKAQSLEEGRKFFYYTKFLSAKATFEKLVAANPKDADAAYWLATTMITPDETKDLPKAREVLTKALEANPNNALLIAGMGHVELHEGKTQEARNRFETAISLSQGKSIAVLNAIGLANGDYDSKNGDANYAIQKLKQATTIKGFKDPETYGLLGDAYRKFTDGGSAQEAYQNALAIDPKYARAKYRIGKIYQTQGTSQEEIYMKYFNEAIALDPNYIPVYFNLYQLFYKTNVPKAAEYLDKYLALKGTDEPDACYYKSTIKYAQGLFAETITQADACIAQSGTDIDPNLYGLKGYAYDKLNDSVNAKAAFEKFFQFQKPDKIGSGDYETYIRILLKFPGNEVLAGTLTDKAVTMDSTEAGKVSLLRNIAARFEAQKQYLPAGEWYKKILNVKQAPTKTDIYYSAYNLYRGGNYDAALADWANYTTKYPDETFGWYMTALAQAKIDTTMEQGLAAPSYQKVIDIGEAQWATDSAKVKGHLLSAYKYFIQYAFNVKKDKKLASDYSAKYLVKEPTDAEVQEFKKIFDNPATKVPSARPATPAAPKTPTPPAPPAKTGTGTTKPPAVNKTGAVTKPVAATTKAPAAKKK
jgi:Flp pilus assembly protein TadD